MEGVEGALEVVRRLQKCRKFSGEVYDDLKIGTIRKIREYLL
jgi:hypothetical protein